jgi:hypothetical protein
VEVTTTFSALYANDNNHDLALHTSNRNAPLEFKSDVWYAEIANIKADLATLIRKRSELKKLIHSSLDNEKENDSDLNNGSVSKTTEPN